MQATIPGPNRTGGALSPNDVMLMMEAVDELSPPVPINTELADTMRLQTIVESDNVGSIPPPAALLKGTVKKGIALMNGVSPNLFLNKIGERMAFERSGTRLYDALISKYLALSEVAGDVLPAVSSVADPDSEALVRPDEEPLDTLRRIRAEEHGHFLMLCEAIASLGGDPTAQTPCADVAATATMGIMQVVTDPRTTMAQSLDAMLIAELTDNASWELLSELAAMAGQDALSERFLGALDAEQEHLVIVQTWLRALTLEQVGTPAV